MEALRELVTRECLADITVTRAVEGYSAHGGIRTTGVVELGDDLPLVVEIVDTAERIERVLPAITSLITAGAMTITEVRLYGPPASVAKDD